MPDYSLVIPVYYNEGCLHPLMAALNRDVIARNPALTYEIIFVEDGSGDRSLAELLEIREQYPRVTIIKLTRNFGQLNALLAGFGLARGKCVIAMSADGQDPPKVINEMLQAFYQEGNEVVVCTREGRDESFYRVFTSRIFYLLIKKLVFPNMPESGFDLVLFGERALKTFLKNIDANPFYQGGILWMGYKTKFIKYHRRQRLAGSSRWTFWNKSTYLLDGILSYSFVPIRLLSLAGLLVAFLGLLYALDIFLEKLLYGNPVTGWAPIMIISLVIGGFQLLMLGMIGEYLWRTLSQVRNREFFVVDTVYAPQRPEGMPESQAEPVSSS